MTMWPFKSNKPVEEAVAGFMATVPIIVDEAWKRSEYADEYPRSFVSAMAVGMYLFALCELMPYRVENNIEKMYRAYQTAWGLIALSGASEEEARDWFQSFNARLVMCDSPPNRAVLMTRVVWERANVDPSEGSHLDFMPILICNIVRRYKSIDLI